MIEMGTAKLTHPSIMTTSEI